MAAVDVALNEIDRILDELRKNVTVTPDQRVKLVVEARRRILEQISQMMAALGADEKFRAKPELARQFSDKLASLRQVMAALQAKWRAVTITENFAGYAQESKSVADACVEFVGWAKVIRITA